MSQQDIDFEARIDDILPGTICEVVKQGEENTEKIEPNNALNFPLYESDRVIVRKGWVTLMFMYSGDKVKLSPDKIIPGQPASYVIQKDKPSPFSQIRKAVFDLFKGTGQLEENYISLVTKGGNKPKRQNIFPPDDCCIKRSDTLVIAWNVKLEAPILEITWKSNGRSVAEPDNREYQRQLSDLFRRDKPDPDDQEIILNWRLSDKPINFEVNGKILVLKTEENFEPYLMPNLTEDEKIRWQLGQLIEKKLYISARSILKEYLIESPEQLNNSVFLKKCAKFLMLEGV